MISPSAVLVYQTVFVVVDVMVVKAYLGAIIPRRTKVSLVEVTRAVVVYQFKSVLA